MIWEQQMGLGESDTRAKLIAPALHSCGWTEDLIRREETPGPFNLRKASKEGEIYVIPGELKFINKVLEENKISIFDMKPT